jgi:hypothetical protein
MKAGEPLDIEIRMHRGVAGGDASITKVLRADDYCRFAWIVPVQVALRVICV